MLVDNPKPEVDAPAAADPNGPLSRAWRTVLLLAVANAAFTAVLADHQAFWYDDYWHLQVAHDLGWSWTFLGRPVYGHVFPGFNLLIGLVAGPGGRHHGAAVLMLSVMAALTPVAAWAAARSLRARPVPALLAAAVASTAAPIATCTTWWSAGVLTLPPMLCGMVVVVGTQRMKAGRRSGAPLAAAAFLVGLLTNEGAAIFLLPPLLIALLCDPGTGPERVRRVLRGWRGWLVVASPIVVALVVRAHAATHVAQPSAHPRLFDLVRFPFTFLVKAYLPGQFGLALGVVGHVQLFGSTSATVLAGVVATAGLGWWLHRVLGDDLWRIAAVVGATVLARGLIVAWGRLVLFGWRASIEGRYYADLMWIAPVLVAAHWPAGRRRAEAVRTDRATTVLAASLCLAGVVGQAVIAVGAPAAVSRRYRDHLASSWAAEPAGTSLVDVMAPPSIIGGELTLFTFLSRTSAQGLPVTYAPSRSLVAPDASGRLRPVQLSRYSELQPARAFTAAGAPATTRRHGCWDAGPRGALVWVPLSIPVVTTAWVLDLQLSGPSDPVLGFVAAGTAPEQFVVASPEGRGRDRWIVSLGKFQASVIGFQMRPNSSLCLASGAVTFPEATGPPR